MKIKIGINGFGRIGRVICRLAEERDDLEIVAINDLLDINYMLYMLKYDSTHGKFSKNISIDKNHLVINNKFIRCTSEKNPAKLKWSDVNVDVVVESTGIFLTKESTYGHINAGAKKVIITGPSKDNTPMFIMGVNNHCYNNQNIISNASCTTNCLAPLAKLINDNFGIKEALMTTIHAVTSTQKTVDSLSSKDWRGGRSALSNIIPSTTGAAIAVGKVIPELQGKLTGISFRVPVINVSVIDFTVRLKKSTTYNDVCENIKYATKNEFKNIIGYVNDDVVSTDFNNEKLPSVFDAKASIFLNNKFIKLVSWYDNETGYSNQVLNLISYIMNF